MQSQKIDWLKKRALYIEQHIHEMMKVKDHLNPFWETSKIILIYLLVGILWILFSDRLLAATTQDLHQLLVLQMYKGWFYVLASGVVFYFIILKRMRLFSKAVTQIFNESRLIEDYDQQLEEISVLMERQYDLLDYQRNALEHSDLRYRLAVEGSHDALWEWDLDSNHYHSSMLSKPQYQLSATSALNNIDDWIAMLYEEDRSQVLEALNQFIESDNDLYENTYRICTRAGAMRWIHSRAVAFRDERGIAKKIAGSHTDITDSIHLSEKMHQEKELLETILQRAPVMILLLDSDGRIVRFNPMAERLTGYSEQEAKDQSVLALLSPSDLLEAHRDIAREVFSGKRTEPNDVTIRCKNGHQAEIIWYNSLIKGPQGDLKYVLSVGVDDTENRKMLDQLYDLAYFDPLTRLSNRSNFRRQVQQQLEDAVNASQTIAVVYLDLVNFKHINDSVGVEAGDQLLQEFSDRLKRCVPEAELMARIGGDEFGLMLSSKGPTQWMIERMHSAAESLTFKWRYHEQEFFIAATMGMALYPAHGCDFNSLEVAADTALFYGKEFKKGKCVIFEDAMLESLKHSVQMHRLLQKALEQDRYALVYQPIIDLNRTQIVGVEALIRLKDDADQPVSPISFIPFAEKHGYIQDISDWVIQTAARQKQAWNRMGLKGLTLSINLSGKSLTDDQLLTQLKQHLKKHHLSPQEFDLEITETSIIEDLGQSLSVLNQLKAFGFSIALDDFGTGYSSLTYLQKLPIDTVKIDRAFLHQITAEEDAAHMLKAMIDLSHQLGLSVLAEGVETLEQLQVLLQYGCDFAQGYYFSKPLTPNQTESFIKNWKPEFEAICCEERTQ